MSTEPEQPSEVEFNPDAALHQLRDCDRCGLTPRAWFHLCKVLGTIAGIGYPTTFFIHRFPHGHGCGVSFVLRKHAYSLQIESHPERGGCRIALRRSDADRDDRWDSLFYGDDAPLHWLQLVRALAYSERVGIHINLVENLEHEWTEWQRAQRGRG
jgi:hypothetical protein